MTPWTVHQLDYCVGLMRNHDNADIPQAALARYLERQRNRALWAGEPVIATGLDFAVARVRAGEWDSAAAPSPLAGLLAGRQVAADFLGQVHDRHALQPDMARAGQGREEEALAAE